MYKIYRKNNYLIIDNGIDNPEGYLAKDILVQEIVVDTIYEMYGVLPKLGNTSNQLLHSVSIPNILKEDNSPYTASEWMDFYTVNTGFFFEVTNGGGGDTGSIPANQFVANYSSLPDPTTVPYRIWICENAEGTQWLPGSLGGTYYPEGGYVSDGTKWIYHKDNYQATQNEVNIGTVTNKWLSPFTFENASKWNTKQTSLVSGVNIKTINSNSILGSGDLSISSIANLTTSQSSTNVTINSDVGTDAVIPLGNGVNAGVSLNDYTTAEKTKLSGIAAGATVNSSDATLLNRSNHTGTQLSSTISDFNTQIAANALLKTNNLSDLANVVTAKTNLSLQNVDNTTDLNKPISTLTQTALNLKANLASPTFTGTVSGITASMVGAPNGSGDSTGINTGDNSVNTTYANDYRAANFIAGTNYLAPNGSAANLTSFPTLNQNTTGTASTITNTITESQVVNLVSDLAAKQNNISLTTTGTSGEATFIGNVLNIPNYATNNSGDSTIQTINFGTIPINEKSFNIVDANCTTTSKIDISQYFISQTEENFGNKLELFTECLNGSFNIIAVSKEPFSRGIFNIKYIII